MSHQYNGTRQQVKVDYSNAPREQRKAYSRMSSTNGKTDLPRNCYSDGFKQNYDAIDWTASTMGHRLCRCCPDMRKTVIYYD